MNINTDDFLKMKKINIRNLEKKNAGSTYNSAPRSNYFPRLVSKEKKQKNDKVL